MTISAPSLPNKHVGSPRAAAGPHGASLFTPWIDFLCLGGGSLLLFIPMMFVDVPRFEPAVAATTLFIAHFINSPHFAHSYQIFYRGFATKAFGPTYSPTLRARYIVAGIVAPLALIGFFAAAFASGNPRILGFGFNIMLFFVGWHYAKQGYGMLIVDAVLKKSFFAARDKRVLVVNSYLCWLLSWAALNNAVASRDMFGLTAYSIAVPQMLVVALGLATAVTTALSCAAIYRRWRSGAPFPFNGAVAYLVTLYLWLLFPSLVAPAVFVVLMVLATPAAHSLQYLIVVWRYQLNLERDKRAAAPSRAWHQQPLVRLALFFIVGVVLAFFGFWVLPTALDYSLLHNRATFGGQVFVFMFAIFINVHHYFLDNVMWRRENPDVSRYLFASR